MGEAKKRAALRGINGGGGAAPLRGLENHDAAAEQAQRASEMAAQMEAHLVDSLQLAVLQTMQQANIKPSKLTVGILVIALVEVARRRAQQYDLDPVETITAALDAKLVDQVGRARGPTSYQRAKAWALLEQIVQRGRAIAAGKETFGEIDAALLDRANALIDEVAGVPEATTHNEAIDDDSAAMCGARDPSVGASCTLPDAECKLGDSHEDETMLVEALNDFEEKVKRPHRWPRTSIAPRVPT